MDAPTTARDRIGRALLLVAALVAVGAGVTELSALGDASDDTVVVEAWRAVGLLFFAALFVVLAAQPRARRGLWEVTLVAKVALPVLGLTVLRGKPEVGVIVVGDGLLVAALVVAYLLTEGWRTAPGATG